MDNQKKEAFDIALNRIQKKHQAKVDEIAKQYKPTVDMLLVKMQDDGLIPYDLSDQELKIYTDFFDEFFKHGASGGFANTTAITKAYECLPETAKEILYELYQASITSKQQYKI